MKTLLKTVVLATLLMIPALTANAQISFGFRIGEPPPPRAYRVPPEPGPGYEWVEGYWYPVGRQYMWHNGYWTRAPYEGAYWVAPYHVGGQYYAGRWEGGRRYIAHNHRWDKSKQRDERRGGRDDNRGRD